MEKETSAGIIIYRRTPEGPRFLLLFRSYWNFPKGKLDVGEKSFRAALRETWEETGLRNKDLVFSESFRAQDRYVFKNKYTEGKKVFKLINFYLAETKEVHIRLEVKHNGYGWFLYREALRELTTPQLKQNLKKAYDIITHKKNPQSGPPHPPRPSRSV